MEGARMAEGLSSEQLAEAQRNFELMKRAADEELWRIACLMACKSDGQLLGRTEFARIVADGGIVHGIRCYGWGRSL